MTAALLERRRVDRREDLRDFCFGMSAAIVLQPGRIARRSRIFRDCLVGTRSRHRVRTDLKVGHYKPGYGLACSIIRGKRGIGAT